MIKILLILKKLKLISFFYCFIIINLGNLLIYLTKLQWLNISMNKINNKGAQDLFNIYKEILEEDLYINLSLSNNIT